MKFEVFVFKFVTAGRQFKAPLKKDKDLDAHQVRLSCSKPQIIFSNTLHQEVVRTCTLKLY